MVQSACFFSVPFFVKRKVPKESFQGEEETKVSSSP